MSYGLRGYDGKLYGLGCNPGETRDVTGGQMICGDDGSTWSPYTPPPPAPVGGGTPVYVPPSDYTPGGGPSEPNCTISAGGLTWVDNNCVAAQSARSIAHQDAVAAAQLAYNLQGCLDSQTPADVCHARYPGVTPSGNFGGPVAPPPTPAPVYTPPANVTPPTGYIPQPSPSGTPVLTPGPVVNARTLPLLVSPGGGSAPASGFSLSDIPWWGWAGAGIAALFAFGGKH